MNAIQRAVRKLDAVSDSASSILSVLAAVGVLLLTFVITYGVLMRFVFNDAQNWTDELASYCLLWVVFFGLAHTLRSEGHIRIDFLAGLLPNGPKRTADVITHLIGLAFALLLFVGCWTTVQNFVRRGTHSTSGLDVPLWLPATALLIGTAVFGLAMLARALTLSANRADDPDAPEDQGR